MTDQTSPEPTDDDDIPPVHFSLRNTDGEASTIELRVPTLGLDPYVLISVGDEGPEVEASHVDFEELSNILTFVLITALQAEQVSPQVRRTIAEIVTDAVEATEEEEDGERG